MKRIKALLEQDPPSPDSRAFLADHGLTADKTVLKNLRSLSGRLAPLCDAEPLLRRILEQIRDTAAPEQALNQVERFLEQVRDPEAVVRALLEERHALRILCTLCGASPYLSGILIQEPDLFLWLIQDRTWNAAATRGELLREILEQCREITDLKQAYPVLRRIKKREILRIGARDLTGFSDFAETTDALSQLAEAALEAAYRLTQRFLQKTHGAPLLESANGASRECGFAILAMGKLGGGELNFSSDIDLLYLYESDGGETGGVPDGAGGMQGRIENHRYFVRLAEGITDLIHAATPEGFVFRVDLRLRPEGSQGPLASSLRTYELYYESFGRTWERAALIKCRPVAGDPSLGRTFEEMLRPFLYRKYLDYAAIEEIKEMKRRILEDLQRRPHRGINIKLDRGGIREIEFLIQALQLIYGGKIPWVREKNSLRALQRLCDKKLITYEDFSVLSKAYLFLRDLEHKLQIENQLQVQTVPGKGPRLEQLARRCGRPDGSSLLQELEGHRRAVQERFENLFYESGEARSTEQPEVPRLLTEDADPEEVRSRLSAMGFRDPSSARENLRLLRDGAPYAHPSSRARLLFHEIGPDLLRELAASPDPDMALNHLERLISSYGTRESLYQLLRAHPPALHKILTLFGTSSYLSNLLIRHPTSLEVLLEEDLSQPPPGKEQMRKELGTALARAPEGPEKLDVLRRFKHVQELGIGLRDILLQAELLEISAALTRLAEACLQAAYALALKEIPGSAAASPPEDPAGLAVMGAGKLGSRELTYGSDLDLILVAPGEGGASTRLAERMVSMLSSLTREGAAYRVDLRLRPQGESGPLVRSLEGFRRYFARELDTWERQAMTKVRFVAGNERTGRSLETLIQETLYAAPPSPELRKEIVRMRRRIEEEKAPSGGGRLYFKTGPGGLVDIEFLVQYLCLTYGPEIPEMRERHPLRVIESAARSGLLSPEDAETLRESYLFLRRLESRARILRDRGVTSLPGDEGANRALALRMGYADGGGLSAGRRLLHDYNRVTSRTRSLFRRFLASGENH